ncbi:MAG: winged helix-turn-helix domain-containing protein [Candidatus Bathyarchaeia archaeon]
MDRVLTSLVRQRILLALQEGELHINELVRRTNSTYTRVSRNLAVLRERGLVEEQYFGQVRMTRLNWKNEKLQAALKALSLLRDAAVGDTR